MPLLPPGKTGETAYDTALRQLASDDIMRDARYRYDHVNLCYVQEPDPDTGKGDCNEALSHHAA